jgi:hypothetical protein
LDWHLFITHRLIEKNTESMAGLTETRDNPIPITSADSVTKIEAGDELSHMENQKLVSNRPFRNFGELTLAVEMFLQSSSLIARLNAACGIRLT